MYETTSSGRVCQRQGNTTLACCRFKVLTSKYGHRLIPTSHDRLNTTPDPRSSAMSVITHQRQFLPLASGGYRVSLQELIRSPPFPPRLLILRDSSCRDRSHVLPSPHRRFEAVCSSGYSEPGSIHAEHGRDRRNPPWLGRKINMMALASTAQHLRSFQVPSRMKLFTAGSSDVRRGGSLRF